MSKKGKYYILLYVSVILVLTVLSRSKGGDISFDEVVDLATIFAVDQSEYISKFENEFEVINGGGILLSDVSSIQDLLNQSDIVAVVTPISRVQYDLMVETRVSIETILKGNYEKKDAYIFELFQGSNVIDESEEEIKYKLTSDYGFLNMQNENKYLVFLKEEKGYQKRNRFSLVSALYGVYPVNQELIIDIYKDTDEMQTLFLNLAQIKKTHLVSFEFSEAKFGEFYQEIYNERYHLENELKTDVIDESEYEHQNQELNKKIESIKKAQHHVDQYTKLYFEIFEQYELEHDVRINYK